MTLEKLDPPAPLCTPRQIEVVTLLANGLTYNGAAVQLGISVKTVRRHIRHARVKMQCATTAELVAKMMALQCITYTFKTAAQAVESI